MASIEREVENGLINAVSGVSGLSYFTSERSTARTLPFVSAKAEISEEELGPFTGVFKMSAILSYHQRADALSRSAFDSKFQDLMAQLYQSPNLSSVMTQSTNITVFNAKVVSESPSVVSKNRTWVKDVELEIRATAKK